MTTPTPPPVLPEDLIGHEVEATEMTATGGHGDIVTGILREADAWQAVLDVDGLAVVVDPATMVEVVR